MSKKKKNFFMLIFSRSMVMVLLLIFQLIYFFYIFQGVYDFLVYISSFLSIIMSIYILNTKKNPNVKVVWITLILIFPIMSILFYWFNELNPIKLYLNYKINNVKKVTKNLLIQKKEVVHNMKDNLELRNLSIYISNYGGYVTNQNTDIKYYSSGELIFEEMIKCLKEAKEFIFLEYFIIDFGYMWDSILNVLKEKVKEGVEVRVMYDGMCSFSTLPYGYYKELISLGIRSKSFSQVKPFLSTHYNNRDHRKIMIIDGKIGFTGGINLADEYINKIEKFGYWKDTGIKIVGDDVDNLTLMFLQMWNVDNKEYDNFLKYLNKENHIKNNSFVISYGDEPFDDELLARNIYMDIINNSKNYVYIATPYFIPDNDLLSAILLASKRGVDVRLILPHIPDKEIAFSLAHTKYKILKEANVKIYEFSPGFVHAKMIISDDMKAVVGTINFDYRSLYQNFECGTYIYNSESIKDIKKDFENIIEVSKFITYEDIKNDKLKRKILGIVLKLIAPLL